MEDMVVTVVGNLTADPQNGSTHVGEAWTSFRIAHNRRRFDRQIRQWVDGVPSFLRVTCYRALAVNALASFAKGDRVVVHGRLRIAQWTGADGHTQTSAQIDADAVGHDLTWGTSVFTRAPRSGPERLDGAPDFEVSPEAGDGVGAGRPDGWEAMVDLTDAIDVTDADDPFAVFAPEGEGPAAEPAAAGEAASAPPAPVLGGEPAPGAEPAPGGEPPAGEAVSTVTAVQAQPQAPAAEREPARSRRR